MLRYLFSFRGRIGRARFWLIAPIFLGFIATVLLFVPIANTLFPPKPTVLIGFVAIGLFLFFLFIAAAIAAKRLHDRSWSGWWLCTLLPQWPAAYLMSQSGLLSLLHVANVGAAAGWLYVPALLWLGVELGVLPSAAGENRYGDAPRSDVADVFR